MEEEKEEDVKPIIVCLSDLVSDVVQTLDTPLDSMTIGQRINMLVFLLYVKHGPHMVTFLSE